MRALAMWTYRISGGVIALGGLGHSLGGYDKVQLALAGATLAPPIQSLLAAVWHFAGAAMVVLGTCLLLEFRRWRRAPAQGLVLGPVVALFYTGFGAYAVWFTADAFFWTFVVLGGLTGASTLVITRNH